MTSDGKKMLDLRNSQSTKERKLDLVFSVLTRRDNLLLTFYIGVMDQILNLSQVGFPHRKVNPDLTMVSASAQVMIMDPS